jgi:hypothetical protein
VWLHKAAADGVELDVTWRAFVLDEVNRKEGDAPTWEKPEGERGRSLLSLVAGKAAVRQAPELFETFHRAVLAARHDGARIRLDIPAPLLEIAEKVGLDTDRLKRDMDDPELLAAVAADHTEASETHGVFGTPTFLFDSGQSVFVKTFIPPDDEAADALTHFVGLMSERSYIGEVKRPQPPWPKGAV